MLTKLLFERANTGVVQDKTTPWRSGRASVQLRYTTDETPIRHANALLPPNPTSIRQERTGKQPTHHGSQTRQLKELAGCVTPEVFSKVEELRWQWARQHGKEERLSRSEVVGELVTKGVQGHVDMQYGALLKPVIENTIERKLHAFGGRNLTFAQAAYYAAERNRLLITMLFRILSGQSQEVCDYHIEQARRQAYDNLTKKLKEIEMEK